MRKNETGTRAKVRTSALNQIRRLEETILTIRSTLQDLNKNVTVQSGMLRDVRQSSQAPQSEEIELMFTMLDRYLRAGATVREIEESLVDLLTELKNKV